MPKSNWILIAGDILALAVITVIGFASHGETDISFAPRMFTTFIPLVVELVPDRALAGTVRCKNIFRNETTLASAAGDAAGCPDDRHPASRDTECSCFAIVHDYFGWKRGTRDAGLALDIFFAEPQSSLITPRKWFLSLRSFPKDIGTMCVLGGLIPTSFHFE